MQTPCNSNCLPTGPRGHESVCPKPNNRRHCIDCRGYFPKFEGEECSRCRKFWCTDEELVFFKLDMCEHFDRDTERSDTEKQSLLQLLDGICPQCAFVDGDVFCSDITCPLSYWIFLANWVKFCSSRVILGKYELSNRQKDVWKIVLYFHRTVNAARITDVWPIDTRVFWLEINGESITFPTIESALEKARAQIQKKLHMGFQPSNTTFEGIAGTGPLYHTRLFEEKKPSKRDASPRRE
jgi:hypothetical protein